MILFFQFGRKVLHGPHAPQGLRGKFMPPPGHPDTIYWASPISSQAACQKTGSEYGSNADHANCSEITKIKQVLTIALTMFATAFGKRWLMTTCSSIVSEPRRLINYPILFLRIEEYNSIPICATMRLATIVKIEYRKKDVREPAMKISIDIVMYSFRSFISVFESRDGKIMESYTFATISRITGQTFGGE